MTADIGGLTVSIGALDDTNIPEGTGILQLVELFSTDYQQNLIEARETANVMLNQNQFHQLMRCIEKISEDDYSAKQLVLGNIWELDVIYNGQIYSYFLDYYVDEGYFLYRIINSDEPEGSKPSQLGKGFIRPSSHMEELVISILEYSPLKPDESFVQYLYN